MRVLIVHGSRMGSTKEIAERIGAILGAAGVAYRVVAAQDRPDPGGWDAYVVGSGIYGGRWHEDALEFVRRNRDTLADRPAWLFSSGPVGKWVVERYDPVDPKEIDQLRKLVRPRDHRVFGGAFDRANIERAGLGPAARFIAERFIPEGDFRDWVEIEAWAREIARELGPVPASDGG